MTWMQTFTGRKFFPLDPDPEQIDILDIAHALSQIPRFGGHAPKWYSVAEHSLIGTTKLSQPFRLAFLLHDAHEAYLGDIVRPLKRQLDLGPAAARLDRAIEHRFGLPEGSLNLEAIRMVDNRMLGTESMLLFPKKPAPWEMGQPYPGVALYHWSPVVAKDKFLKVFTLLTERGNR